LIMSRYTIPYRELPPLRPRWVGKVRRAAKVFGWALALTALAVVCAVLGR
jgi:hypothetical protein